ncbi:MAG: VCBS repeat-containing protein, partial [Gemmatimonadaceae bacterium]|nr:VCBS repeat-containing protein [Gloeobacterales cyanobacterium ES-bin-141]
MSHVQASLGWWCLVSGQSQRGKTSEQITGIVPSQVGRALKEVGRGTATSLAALGLAATVGLWAVPVHSQVSFITAPTYALGDSPQSIATGDLDGDGDLDLAVGTGNNVSVLKNNGNGTFAAPQTFAGGGGSLLVGDLDGDSDLDLVAG